MQPVCVFARSVAFRAHCSSPLPAGGVEKQREKRTIVLPMSPAKKISSNRRRAAVSIRDVASRARVSIATVSRAVNGISTVDPELVKRVWKAVEEVGYLPNQQERAL